MKFSELKEEDIEELAKRFNPEAECEVYNYGHYFGINILNLGRLEIFKDGSMEVNGLFFFDLKNLNDWIAEKQLEFEI